jgi:hypothetical protein
LMVAVSPGTKDSCFMRVVLSGSSAYID